MFFPQFYSNNTKNHTLQPGHTERKCEQHFDWHVNYGCVQYAIQKIKDQNKQVIAIKLFRHDGCQFEFAQEFCVHQFHGAFFANIRAEDYHCNGTIDLVADVYDAHCYLCGTAILTHKSTPSGHHNHSHQYQDPCASPTISFPCPPPPHKNPCLAHTVSRSDITSCKLLCVDVKDAQVTSVNEIFVKPLSPITSTEKLCDIIQCCKKTTECLKEFDPHFASKFQKKGHTTYSGPVKAETGWININDCSITFDGLDVPCSKDKPRHNFENCIKF